MITLRKMHDIQTVRQGNRGIVSMKKTHLKIIGVNTIVFLLLLVLLEATAQVVALLYPSYDVLFLQPDKVLGWKQVPNHSWPWAGHNWYANDFSIRVKTNSLGFRDTERDFSKSSGVKRVAILGDSFIEAVQVPFKKTACQLLEHSLNSSSEDGPGQSIKWEVLNLGISNYGVGQYLLTWEEYARKFNPDYIAIFVAQFHMRRTIDGAQIGAFASTKNKRLLTRPTFRLANDILIREPAKDYDEFVKLQEDLIRTEFAGKRFRKKKGLVTVHFGRIFLYRLRQCLRRFRSGGAHDTDFSHVNINLKIIEELGRQTDSAGTRLVVLDASQYFGDNETISIALNKICKKNGLGYIPLYDNLLKANRDGISTRWGHDNHFNETGNLILAKALNRWIIQDINVEEAKKDLLLAGHK